MQRTTTVNPGESLSWIMAPDLGMRKAEKVHGMQGVDHGAGRLLRTGIGYSPNKHANGRCPLDVYLRPLRAGRRSVSGSAIRLEAVNRFKGMLWTDLDKISHIRWMGPIHLTMLQAR